MTTLIGEHHAYRCVVLDTPQGQRPFTDISVLVSGTWIGARLHGWLNPAEIASHAEATRARALKEWRP